MTRLGRQRVPTSGEPFPLGLHAGWHPGLSERVVLGNAFSFLLWGSQGGDKPLGDRPAVLAEPHPRVLKVHPGVWEAAPGAAGPWNEDGGPGLQEGPSFRAGNWTASCHRQPIPTVSHREGYQPRSYTCPHPPGTSSAPLLSQGPPPMPALCLLCCWGKSGAKCEHGCPVVLNGLPSSLALWATWSCHLI